MDNNKAQFLDTREETVRWLDKYQIENYTINDDLSVDVNGDVNISNKKLKTIPVKFVNVTGSFWCHNNKLTSFIGSPKTVLGGFHCDNNKLTSLVGAPETIGSNFWCDNNQLTSLVGAPKTVGGHFSCGCNKLVNLADSPETVGGDFRCTNNPLTSLFEIIDCDFRKAFYFNIKSDFKQKELIQALKKYYNSKHERYELTNHQFRDTLKPQIEKEILKQKLTKNDNNSTNIKNVFI